MKKEISIELLNELLTLIGEATHPRSFNEVHKVIQKVHLEVNNQAKKEEDKEIKSV